MFFAVDCCQLKTLGVPGPAADRVDMTFMTVVPLVVRGFLGATLVTL